MTASPDPTSEPTGADGAELEKELDRQLAIWTGMYGPARATEMVATLRARATADDNDRALADLAKEIDPDDEDWEEGGLSRPGVG